MSTLEKKNRFKNPTEDQSRLLASLATLPAHQQMSSDASWFPPVDILEDDGEYVFRVDLPGLKPESIRVAVNKDSLSITGHRVVGHGRKKALRVERPCGPFVRRFALPDDASRTKIRAILADCVLELSVQKAGPEDQSKARPDGVEVQVHPA